MRVISKSVVARFEVQLRMVYGDYVTVVLDIDNREITIRSCSIMTQVYIDSVRQNPGRLVNALLALIGHQLDAGEEHQFVKCVFDTMGW